MTSRPGVSKIKTTYPNAYEPWTAADDDRVDHFGRTFSRAK
jgi:hypothetical protein